MAQLIHGENVVVTVGGDFKIEVDGDVQLKVERDVLEKKLRGKAVKAKIPSKTINLDGTIKGMIQNTLWEDVLAPFLGITGTSLDTTTDITNVSPNNFTVAFDWKDGGKTVTLTGCVAKSVTVDAPNEDVVSVEIEFGANGISAE